MAAELGERIKAVLALEPEKGALEFKGTWHSWGAVASVIEQIEAIFAAAGVGEGAPVGILLRNRPAHVAAVLQILASKRCIVAINPFQSASKIADDLRKLQLPALVADHDDWQVQEVLQACKDTASVGVAISSTPLLGVDTVSGLTSLRVDKSYAQPMPDMCVLMLTSGTTGPAKRVELPYRNFERALFDAVHYESRGADTVLKLKDSAALLSTPLVHIGGLYAAVFAVVGARPLAILEKFNVEEWSKAVAAYKPRTVSLPPTAIRMILDAKVPAVMLESLLAIRTGSAPLDPAMVDEFEHAYGCPLLDTYGATEFAGAVAGWTLKDYRAFAKIKRGSVGRAQPGCDLRVVDSESGAVLPPLTVGLLEVRSVQIDPQKWLRTTDLAEIDSEGFLFIRGRADDAIIRGGFKILPREVEKALRDHPAVKDVCVVGMPDARLGAVPVAAIHLEEGAENVSAEQLLGFARERLVSYQIPTRILFVDALPRTPSLKVSQHEVRALFL
jgi:acyl-CoA synthetase (AMP-forming)/AMP-acid ligase II